MSNIAFDFLSESFLFDEMQIRSHYKTISEDEIKRELNDYRKHIEQNLEGIRHEVINKYSSLNTSIESLGKLPDEELLKQLALYIDMVIIDDPIFSHSDEKGASHQPMSELMGLTSTTDINRARLAKDVNYVKRSNLLVASQYIKYFPISLLHEAPKDIPLLYSKNNFESDLPSHIMKYFRERVQINNVDRKTGFMTVNEKASLIPGTTIHVSFIDDLVESGMIFQYMQSKVINLDDKAQRVTFHQTIPKEISETEFINWVNHSVNRAAIQFYTRIFKEVYLSKQLNCMYVSKSLITSDLLKMSVAQQDMKTDLTNLSMHLNLPVVDSLSVEEIIGIRQNSGEAFHNFRNALNEKLLDLRFVDDSDELKMKLENISYELNEIQVAEVSKEYRKILRSLKLDVAIFSGCLLTSFCTGGLSLVGAAGAAIKGMTDYAKYLSEVKENNGYFLWRINREVGKL